jgi:hypothetical protein
MRAHHSLADDNSSGQTNALRMRGHRFSVDDVETEGQTTVPSLHPHRLIVLEDGDGSPIVQRTTIRPHCDAVGKVIRVMTPETKSLNQ